MSRRVHDLTLAGLADLPPACRACVFWETTAGRRGPAVDTDAGRAGKEAWWQATQLEWGTPGKAVYVDGALAGYVTFAPAAHFPGVRRLGPSVSEDALLLATMWIDPAERAGGLAAMLLQAVLRETVRRGTRALEAFGERGAQTVEPAGCVLPEEFLLANGFAVHREHPTHPLLRLDSRQTVRWQTSVGHAVEGVIEALSRRERRAPAPARPTSA
jgi:GNAT superfamily N-acetyltransferase